MPAHGQPPRPPEAVLRAPPDADPELIAADRAASRGDRRDAIERCRRFLRQPGHPAAPYARFRLAELLQASGDPAGARVELDYLTRTTGPARRAALLTLVALDAGPTPVDVHVARLDAITGPLGDELLAALTHLYLDDHRHRAAGVALAALAARTAPGRARCEYLIEALLLAAPDRSVGRHVSGCAAEVAELQAVRAASGAPRRWTDDPYPVATANRADALWLEAAARPTVEGWLATGATYAAAAVAARGQADELAEGAVLACHNALRVAGGPSGLARARLAPVARAALARDLRGITGRWQASALRMADLLSPPGTGATARQPAVH